MKVPGENDHLITGSSIWNHKKGCFSSGQIFISDGLIEDISFDKPLSSSGSVGAERWDIGENLLFPAFLDSHMHLFQWSRARQGIDLRQCRSPGEIMELLNAVRNGTETNLLYERKGALIGNDYDESTFVKGSELNGGVLQKLFPDTPVVLRRICGHKAVVNEAGADLLDVKPDEGGFIFEEEAMEITWKMDLDGATSRISLQQAIDELHSMGVVGGVDIIPSSRVVDFRDSFKDMKGSMDLSISVISDPGSPTWKGHYPQTWNEAFPGDSNGDPPVVFQKFFLDGSIGSRTASFSMDYLDSRKSHPIHSDAELKLLLEGAATNGLVPMMHCIGDLAVDQAVRIGSEFGSPFRLEHAESITRRDLNAMRSGNGALCLQPNFSYLWGNKGGLYESALGKKGLELNPFGVIDGSGVPWCFGTDMMPPGPLFAIRGSVHSSSTKKGISSVRSLAGFTWNSSILSFLQNRAPCLLEPEAPANIVVMDNAMENVIMTFKNGRLVHSLF
ncbi:MAG: amidohydrolase family protein [Thermoplasmatota archaeon]